MKDKTRRARPFKLQTLAGTYYPQPKPPKRTVTLIPSGYEWICPICLYYNELTEPRDKVTCTLCKTEFDSKVEYPS